MRRRTALPISALALGLALAGCSSSDTDTATTETETATQTSAEPSAAPDPLVAQAAEEYQAYAVDQSDQLVTAVKVLTDAVRAGDLQAAQDAYAPSREPWERIEPLAGLVEEIDGLVDARVDDFAGVDDPAPSPAGTGWSTCCSSRTRPTAAHSSRTSWTRTSPPSTSRCRRSRWHPATSPWGQRS